jgi:hypothetical protein
LDLKFIDRAERITSFNLDAPDFQSTTHKKEIQYLFQKHFFNDFEISLNALDFVDLNSLNQLINKLKEVNKEMFANLHRYSINGIGPGEITLYLLLNNSFLGGGSSAGVDLVVGSEKFEVKAVQVMRVNDHLAAYDFKLGGTVRLDDVTQSLVKLLNYHKMDGSRTEIKKSTINVLRNEKDKQIEFAQIEDKYRKRAYEYFKDHKVIFINNSKSAKQGNIESIKNINETDIMIERVTSGTIKPMVFLD